MLVDSSPSSSTAASNSGSPPIAMPASASAISSSSISSSAPRHSADLTSTWNASLRNGLGFKQATEAARTELLAFCQQQAPVVAAMLAQRLQHVAAARGLVGEVDALHREVIGEFIPSFLECLHNCMTSSNKVSSSDCEVCSVVSQQAAMLATPKVASIPNGTSPQNRPYLKTPGRSNSISFVRSPYVVVRPPGPPGGTLPESQLVIGELGASPSSGSFSSSSSPPNSKGVNRIRQFFGNVIKWRSRTTSIGLNGNCIQASATDSDSIVSPLSASLPVEVVLEGVLEQHVPETTSRNHALLRGFFDSSASSVTSGVAASVNDSSYLPLSPSPLNDSANSSSTNNSQGGGMWLPCHVRLLKTSAGPILELVYAPTTPPPGCLAVIPPSGTCGIAMSAVNEVRPATIGDMLTNDDHVFILLSSALSSRVLLKASCRVEMNRWLDALRHCTSHRPVAMAPLQQQQLQSQSTLTPGAQAISHSHNASSSSFSSMPGPIGQTMSGGSSASVGNGPIATSPLSAMTVMPSHHGGSPTNEAMVRRRILTCPASELLGYKRTGVATAVPAVLTMDSRQSSIDSAMHVATASPVIGNFLTTPGGTASSNGDDSAQKPLETQPWYWGAISRRDATEVVMQFGRNGIGCFIVRKSESQPDCYVVTFNFDGVRPKHLRMRISPDDWHCQLNQFWFASVQAMLDYFRTHPLPLVDDATGDPVTAASSDSTATLEGVMLVNYVTRSNKSTTQMPTSTSSHNNRPSFLAT